MQKRTEHTPAMQRARGAHEAQARGAQTLARVALTALLACGPGAAAAVEPAETARRIVEGTNAFRKEQELEPASVNAELQAAAREFARYMARTGKYSHTADGRQPSERAAKQGYDYCIVSENIAYHFRSRG